MEFSIAGGPMSLAKTHAADDSSERVLAITGDGLRIVSAGRSGLHTWDRETGGHTELLADDLGPGAAVAITGDGSRIVYAGKSGLHTWDQEPGGHTKLLADDLGPGAAVAITGDGLRIVSAGRNGLHTWDRKIDRHTELLADDLGPGAAVAITEDKIASAGLDGTVRTWDLIEGEWVHIGSRDTGHKAPVAVAITSDGERVVSWAADGSMQIWNPSPQGWAERARAVELAGRMTRIWTTTAWACGAVILGALSLIDSWSAQNVITPLSWVLIAVAAALLVAAGTRCCARRVIRRGGISWTSESKEDGPGAPKKDDPATIICCSGGGIKSAAFCLGALQALDDPERYPGAGKTEYQQSSAVIGVSGGGYTAGAYAALQHDPAHPAGSAPPAFAEKGNDVAVLRRRTNYLASSLQVRYDLAASLLFGLTINLVILGAVEVVLAVLLGGHAFAVHLITVGEVWDVDTALVFRALLVPAVLLAIAVLMFFSDRFFRRGDRSWRLITRARFGGQLPDLAHRRWRQWFVSTPYTLVACAVGLALLYPGVPVAATQWHNFWQDFWQTDHSSGWISRVGAALTVSLAFIALVRSAMKATNQRQSGTIPGHLLALFRVEVAPRLAVTLAAAAAYTAVVVLTATYLARFRGSFDGWILIIVVVALALVELCSYANKTSLFPFYRDRLDYTFFQHDPQQSDASTTQEKTGSSASSAARKAKSVLLRDLAHRPDRPDLVLVATANLMDDDTLPAGRNGTPFIFSARGVGFTDENLPGGAYHPCADAYQPGGSLTLDVATATAISGAAISPVAGRETNVIAAYRVLLALVNVRLGVWVRNPYWTSHSKNWAVRATKRLDAASPFQVVEEALGRPSIYNPYVYVTDGGHYDNLGLVEALRRKPTRIILLDGSGDPEDQFPAMGEAIATARMDLQTEVKFDPRPLQRGNRLHPRQGWVRASATYSDRSHCRIDYVKCVLPAGLSWDLESYRLQNPDFPGTSTKYEMYKEFDFEAYRKLGWSLIDDAEKHAWVEPNEWFRNNADW